MSLAARESGSRSVPLVSASLRQFYVTVFYAQFRELALLHQRFGVLLFLMTQGRLVANGNSAGLACFSFLALAEIHEVDKAF